MRVFGYCIALLALTACASPYEIAKDGLRDVKTTETEITSSLKRVKLPPDNGFAKFLNTLTTRHPNAPANRLLSIAQHPDRALRFAVIGNPNTPDIAIRNLASAPFPPLHRSMSKAETEAKKQLSGLYFDYPYYGPRYPRTMKAAIPFPFELRRQLADVSRALNVKVLFSYRVATRSYETFSGSGRASLGTPSVEIAVYEIAPSLRLIDQRIIRVRFPTSITTTGTTKRGVLSDQNGALTVRWRPLEPRDVTRRVRLMVEAHRNGQRPATPSKDTPVTDEPLSYTFPD